MLKKLLFTALVGFWPFCSYSESIAPYYGYTGNAAGNGLTWDMGTVLPSPPGLDINSVIYSYTPLKNPADPMQVHIQNKNALGTGYIFRETDDWSGVAGGVEIRKVIGLPGIPRQYWGEGSIEVEGKGTISDPSVIYTYKVDPCYDPQFNPNCPGYVKPTYDMPQVSYDLYDATAGDANQSQYNPDDRLYEEEEGLSEEKKAQLEEEEKRDSRERLEKALAAANNTALFAQALANSQMLDTINSAVNMTAYYNATIAGGVYKDNVTLLDKKIPESRTGLRNGLAQQILHQRMVDMQYGR